MDVRTLCNKAEDGLRALAKQQQDVLNEMQRATNHLQQLQALERQINEQIIAAKAVVSGYRLVMDEDPIQGSLPVVVMPEKAEVTLTPPAQ